MSTFQLAKISELSTHEAIDNTHFLSLLLDILTKGYLHHPLLVDKRSKVILDGHHRYHVLRYLKAKKAPVLYIDYLDVDIKVYPRRKELPLEKTDVVKMGASQHVFPLKTTNHNLESKSGTFLLKDLK